MTVKVFFVKLKNKDKELWNKMKDKDVEVERLKTEEPEELEESIKRKNQKSLLKSLKKLERSIMI